MIDKVFTLKNVPLLTAELHMEKLSIVLAGGCFDVIHPGHIQFLSQAKQAGDSLILLLESDARIKKEKGEDRPIHTQAERAFVLSALCVVDYIILLPKILRNDEYDKLVIQLKPAIMATTAGDPFLKQRKEQAATVGAKVISIPKTVLQHSTTRVAELLAKDI